MIKTVFFWSCFFYFKCFIINIGSYGWKPPFFVFLQNFRTKGYFIMEKSKNDVKKYAINFSEKQISKPRKHTAGKIDITTGKPLMMCKLYIPSKEYRPADIDLGTDSNGIDRNERKGYINIPYHNVYKDKNKEGRLFVYFDSERPLKINFAGEKTGRTVNYKPEYDSPEPLQLTAEEFVHLYDGAKRTKDRNVSQDRTVEKSKQHVKDSKKTSQER